MQISIKKRGRPAAYDKPKALLALRDIFWLKGAAATSLDDIVLATGMNRPSLYAAFGDKRAMYFAALESFACDVRQGVDAALDHPDLAKALERFYDGAILQYTTGPVQRGCMAVCIAALDAGSDEQAKQFLDALLTDIEQALRLRFQTASQGKCAVNPDVGATIAASVLHSLAVRARAGASPEMLKAIAADTIALIA